MPQWVNMLLSFSEPSSRVHKVLKSNGKMFCALFTYLMLLYFVEQLKIDFFFLVTVPKYVMGRKRNFEKKKPQRNPKCLCSNLISALAHVGIAPVNFQELNTPSLGDCEQFLKS